MWINLSPAKGTETKKKRPCIVISNNQYNRYFNTIIIVPISSSKKYLTLEKYIKSPLFLNIEKDNIQGTALLQHLRTIDPAKQSNGKVVARLTPNEIKTIHSVIQQFL
ncbi:mRNA interferase [Limosilactobacillus caviae]|uniref:mRNA interferase n=1 Tax=Limosilactobacillus caviae TaxID=1769424 RepID=A0ABQ2C1Q3_9LACO|nr:mRNA interferase [Limosilactobacillus caviae]